MTVAEIKEYIDNSIQESEQVGMSGYDSALYLKNSMRTVRSMLDKLELNEQIKWERDIAIQQLNELGYQFGEKVWEEFDFESQDLLKDHYYYLVAHVDYGTPMKAKWHDDGLPHFEVCDMNGNKECVSVFDERITHWCRLPNSPKGSDEE